MSPRLIMLLSLTLILLLSGCTEKKSTHSEKPASNLPVALAAPLPTPNEEKTADGLNKGHEGATTNLISTNSASSNKNVIYFGAGSLKRVALTFDDGPDKTYTSKILDILKQNDVKATFFVVGIHAERYPEMIKRISQEGHVIGNHSWDHANLSKQTPEEVAAEIEKTDELVQQMTGSFPYLFRAPYGAISKEMIDEVNKTPNRAMIEWSVDTQDWEGISPARILANVKKEVRPGAIILEHCSGGRGGNLSNTVQALPQIISYLKKEGYTFVTVPELLNPA